MKRLFIVILVGFSFTFVAFAKSLEIVRGDFFVTTTPNTDEIKAHCIFKNISDKEINVKLNIKLIEASDNLEVSFCWGPICYPPLEINDLREPLDVITLQPGQISGENEFYISFYPNGNVGRAIVEAVIFDRDNPSDSLNLTFQLVSSLDVDDLQHLCSSNMISVSDYLDFEKIAFTSGPIYIFTLNGSFVQTILFPYKYNFSTLPNGIYLLIQLNPQNKLVIINKF